MMKNHDGANFVTGCQILALPTHSGRFRATAHLWCHALRIAARSTMSR